MNKKLIKNAEKNNIKVFKDTKERDVYFRNDFFEDEAIRLLRTYPSGDLCLLIYMKICCAYINEEGILDIDGYTIPEIAKKISEAENKVLYAIGVLKKVRLV